MYCGEKKRKKKILTVVEDGAGFVSRFLQGGRGDSADSLASPADTVRKNGDEAFETKARRMGDARSGED